MITSLGFIIADYGQKITILKILTVVFLEALPAGLMAGLSAFFMTEWRNGELAKLIPLNS